MNIVIKKQELINEIITKDIFNLIIKKDNCVLGLATGTTPLGVYKRICDTFKDKVSFKNVKTFNLDEYYGLDKSDINSYHHFMYENLFSKIDIDLNNTYFPNDIACNNYSLYDELIKSNGGIDYQILGIGRNGHIGFNEPGTSFLSLTHISELQDSTINDNARFFSSKDDVPSKAITMGLKSIMNAKKIVIIAFGKNKALAINRLINGQVDEKMPASILKYHKNVTLFLDEDAAKKLK